MTPASPRRDRPVVFINLWREGGMRHYADSLVHALGDAVPVFYLRNYPSPVAPDGLVLDVDFHPLRPGNWWGLLRIARLLRELRPRAVHLNNEQPLLLPLYPLLALMNSVITLHDARSHAGESLAKRIFHAIHLRLVSCFIRKVIVHSAMIRDALPPWFQRQRVHIMPFVSARLWSGPPVTPSAPPPLRVLFFGRILAYKGLDVLLTAFSQLDPARFHLTIAGEGDVPAIDAPNISVHNHFIGDDQLPGLFQRTHVVVLPYHAASQSGVVHMALAFGRTVVATRVGALPDVVHDGENGLLIPPGDPVALISALERLADFPFRAQLEANIRRGSHDLDAEVRTRLMEIYDA